MSEARTDVEHMEESAGNAIISQSCDVVRQYHERTKHSFYAYAKGPETLDWDAQPNPFRSFEGAEKFPLSLQDELYSIRYFDLFSTPLTALPVNSFSVSSFLRYAMGLTAWKQYGPDSWSLRVNPSSGNLHPTETYVLLSENMDGLNSGLFHYNVEHHLLEKRADISDCCMPDTGFGIALSSVMWRELWKYGERGFRYTQLDVGHVISAITLSAKAHGWQVALMTELEAKDVADLLGLNRVEYTEVEREIPETLLWIGGNVGQLQNANLLDALPEMSNWQGRPTRLGKRSLYQWPWADDVALASGLKPVNKPGQDFSPLVISEVVAPIVCKSESDQSFQQTALHRRSAQAFDKTAISYAEFETLVASLFSFGQPIFTNHTSPLNFVLMVHQVEGLEPGIYMVPSQSDNLGSLKQACTKWPNWLLKSEIGINDSNNALLYQLTVAKVQKATGTLCCQQAIASDGAFTIGFLGNYEQTIVEKGATAYRHLYWQAGMLSHQLYLSATALNLAATGIGCFFDDPWMGLLGIETTEVQMLYATAVGHPVIDDRITSLSGYVHLSEREALKHQSSRGGI